MPDQSGNLIGFGIEGEVSGVEDVDLGAGNIYAIAFGLAGIEGKVVLAPDDEEAGVHFLHPCLPFGIGVDVSAIVVEKVALDLGLAG